MSVSNDTVSETWSRHSRRTRFVRYLALLFSLIIIVLSWQALNVRYEFVATAPREIRFMLRRMYPPDVEYSAELVTPIIETVHISILGTVLAIFLAIPVAYIGAVNTAPNRPAYYLGKFIIAGTRSVNVIIWALIFVVVFGPGALAGVFAVGLRSIGFISKLIAEEIEEINLNQIEAVEAMGANGIQQLVYGVVPQIKPTFVGVAIYRWDINVRAATVIGFVGAGGIGSELQTSLAFFNWNRVLTILLAILVLVIVSEVVSAYSRKKVR